MWAGYWVLEHARNHHTGKEATGDCEFSHHLSFNVQNKAEGLPSAPHQKAISCLLPAGLADSLNGCRSTAAFRKSCCPSATLLQAPGPLTCAALYLRQAAALLVATTSITPHQRAPQPVRCQQVMSLGVEASCSHCSVFTASCHVVWSTSARPEGFLLPIASAHALPARGAIAVLPVLFAGELGLTGMPQCDDGHLAVAMVLQPGTSFAEQWEDVHVAVCSQHLVFTSEG